MNIQKHKVFISYYSQDDQMYKNRLLTWNLYGDLFEDWSVGNGDIDDTNLSDESVRKIIRDEYIKDATVLVLLCGKNTKHRKFVDWELHAAMYDTEKNPKMGIVVINLPSSRNLVRAIEPREKEIVFPDGEWTTLTSRKEFTEYYPDLPQRILDSVVNKGSEITFVNWDTIASKPYYLRELVDFAFRRRKTMEYDLSQPLRRHNSN